MDKQVLFISIDGMTDQLGQSQVLPYLTGLSKKGYSISIVSCEKEFNFEKNKETVFATMAEYNIAWSYCFYKTKISFISQIQNFFTLKRLATNEVKSKSYIILHCRSYLAALIGLQLKKKYNIKFRTPLKTKKFKAGETEKAQLPLGNEHFEGEVKRGNSMFLEVSFIFDMRGFWADERMDGNIWNLEKPLHKFLYNYFKRKEIEMLEEADYIVTLTNKAKKEIESWKLKSLPNIEVIPCCVDTNHFTISSDEKINSIKNELDVAKNSFVAGYLGSIGTWYMLNEILDFFIELQKKKPNSIFFFITNDGEKDILKAAEAKGISLSAIIIKSAKREEVPAYISCFDIGLFFIKPLYSKKGSSPTKLAELLACGVPIITNSGIGDVDELLLKNNCGILIPSFTKETYQGAIDKIDELNSSKQYYRDIALTNFSLQKGIDSYDKIYNDL